MLTKSEKQVNFYQKDKFFVIYTFIANCYFYIKEASILYPCIDFHFKFFFYRLIICL